LPKICFTTIICPSFGGIAQLVERLVRNDAPLNILTLSYPILLAQSWVNRTSSGYPTLSKMVRKIYAGGQNGVQSGLARARDVSRVSQLSENNSLGFGRRHWGTGWRGKACRSRARGTVREAGGALTPSRTHIVIDTARTTDGRKQWHGTRPHSPRSAENRYR
jgi:hypothetical protein